MRITDSFNEETLRIENVLKNTQKSIDGLEPNHADELIGYIKHDLSNEINAIKQEYINKCEHDNIILVSHDSMVTGREPGYSPNPNHISYYCLRCGKKITKKEMEELECCSWALTVDAYGHPDALLVGYDSTKAIVDYIRDIIHDLAEYQLEFPNEPSFTDAEVANIINVSDLRVPEEYIKRS